MMPLLVAHTHASAPRDENPATQRSAQELEEDCEEGSLCQVVQILRQDNAELKRMFGALEEENARLVRENARLQGEKDAVISQRGSAAEARSMYGRLAC